MSFVNISSQRAFYPTARYATVFTNVGMSRFLYTACYKVLLLVLASAFIRGGFNDVANCVDSVSDGGPKSGSRSATCELVWKGEGP